MYAQDNQYQQSFDSQQMIRNALESVKNQQNIINGTNNIDTQSHPIYENEKKNEEVDKYLLKEKNKDLVKNFMTSFMEFLIENQPEYIIPIPTKKHEIEDDLPEDLKLESSESEEEEIKEEIKIVEKPIVKQKVQKQESESESEEEEEEEEDNSKNEKVRILCDCGGMYFTDQYNKSKNQHMSSQKHKKYEEAINEERNISQLCKCGGMFTENTREAHEKTKYHLSKVKELKKLPIVKTPVPVLKPEAIKPVKKSVQEQVSSKVVKKNKK
jgi:hypothetical protein